MHAGSYNVATTVVLDECGGPCANGEPYGVTLRPLAGVVELTHGASFNATTLQVLTGNNVIEGLSFVDATRAIVLEAGANAGGNLVRGNAFTNDGVACDRAISVASEGNTIEANAITNNRVTTANGAIDASADTIAIAMNVIFGRFDIALSVRGSGRSGELAIVDHNTIWVTGNASTTGLHLGSLADLCYRNNIVYGSGASAGLELDGITASADCGGIAIGNNVNTNHATSCTGTDCATLCVGSGGMCDRNVSPALESGTLCLPQGNALIDGGVPLGYDMWDGDLARYNGAAPEVGARESGVSRAYGATLSSCP